MSTANLQGTQPISEGAEKGKRKFTFPTAFTILFLLLILTAAATFLIPAGAYDVDADGAPIPGTYHQVEANPQELLKSAITAPIAHADDRFHPFIVFVGYGFRDGVNAARTLLHRQVILSIGCHAAKHVIDPCFGRIVVGRGGSWSQERQGASQCHCGDSY